VVVRLFVLSALRNEALWFGRGEDGPLGWVLRTTVVLDSNLETGPVVGQCRRNRDLEAG
jgi:hypothetical protein